jgi:hypothetical protein
MSPQVSYSNSSETIYGRKVILGLTASKYFVDWTFVLLFSSLFASLKPEASKI